MEVAGKCCRSGGMGTCTGVVINGQITVKSKSHIRG